jgi:cellulose synthase/poly-beta-1,6-N-acetylglucosamine synthase-like glycosyltransferase
MKAQEIAIIATFGFICISYTAKAQIESIPKHKCELVDTISVIIPSLNEERLIQLACASLKSQVLKQLYPDKVELILVDSYSTDRTRELAAQYVDRIILAPRGKLTARQIAIKSTLGNIIVSVDADCTYNPHFLCFITQPFKQADVVGVNGTKMHIDGTGIAQPIFDIGTTWHNILWHGGLVNHMDGACSAFRKSAFWQTGGFNLEINQQDVRQMCEEEEGKFADRLKQLGKIIWAPNALCLTTARRFICEDKKYYKEIEEGIRF